MSMAAADASVSSRQESLLQQLRSDFDHADGDRLLGVEGPAHGRRIRSVLDARRRFDDRRAAGNCSGNPSSRQIRLLRCPGGTRFPAPRRRWRRGAVSEHARDGGVPRQAESRLYRRDGGDAQLAALWILEQPGGSAENGRAAKRDEAHGQADVRRALCRRCQTRRVSSGDDRASGRQLQIAGRRSASNGIGRSPTSAGRSRCSREWSRRVIHISAFRRSIFRR